MGSEIVVRVDFSKYKYVDLSVEEALSLLDALAEAMGRETPDVGETRRFLRNFDEFYEYMRKKFKDYMVPPHRPDDYIRGNVVIDKVKLYKNGDERRVVIVVDRRVPLDYVVKALESLGYNVRVEKEL
jgi:hypothetical protein